MTDVYRRRGQDAPEHRGGHSGRPERRRGDLDEFFGFDTEKMSPKAQIFASLALIVPVALSGALLIALTEVGWIWFTYFWVMFYAFPLLTVRGGVRDIIPVPGWDWLAESTAHRGA